MSRAEDAFLAQVYEDEEKRLKTRDFPKVVRHNWGKNGQASIHHFVILSFDKEMAKKYFPDLYENYFGEGRDLEIPLPMKRHLHKGIGPDKGGFSLYPESKRWSIQCTEDDTCDVMKRLEERKKQIDALIAQKGEDDPTVGKMMREFSMKTAKARMGWIGVGFQRMRRRLVFPGAAPAVDMMARAVRGSIWTVASCRS